MPKVGQGERLNPKENQYVSKTSFVQRRVQGAVGAGGPQKNRIDPCDCVAPRGAPGAGETVEEGGGGAAA